LLESYFLAIRRRSGEQRVRSDDTGKVKESFSADGLSSYGQSAALILFEARLAFQLSQRFSIIRIIHFYFPCFTVRYEFAANETQMSS